MLKVLRTPSGRVEDPPPGDSEYSIQLQIDLHGRNVLGVEGGGKVVSIALAWTMDGVWLRLGLHSCIHTYIPST